MRFKRLKKLCDEFCESSNNQCDICPFGAIVPKQMKFGTHYVDVDFSKSDHYSFCDLIQDGYNG